MPKLVTNLWFDTQALEAAEFYVSVFPNSEITDIAYYGEAGPGPAGTIVTVRWELDGHAFVGINGGPAFTFDEAVSVEIACDDQADVDYYWEKLLEGGGEESQCGWLKDRYGFSWQVVPRRLWEMLLDPDREAADRATAAMLGMRKLDIATLEAAFTGP